VKEKGFVRVDSDAGGAGESRAAKAWRAVLQRLGTADQFEMAQEFVKVARYNLQPVVPEYGMYANADGIALLRTLRDAGAETWWFDGDHAAAFGAWQAENVKAARDMADAHWHHVVNIINAKMSMVTEFFGPNIARTIESGPTHIVPVETFKAMFSEGS
jgi:hypothetical protein